MFVDPSTSLEGNWVASMGAALPTTGLQYDGGGGGGGKLGTQ